MGHTELDLRERRAIEGMLNAKVPVSKIAAEIGRHRSTVYREIKRRRLQSGIGTESWFCDPQAPWQKGSLENLNKRARRYLPRDTQLAALSPSRHLFFERSLPGIESRYEGDLRPLERNPQKVPRTETPDRSFQRRDDETEIEENVATTLEPSRVSAKGRRYCVSRKRQFAQR